MRTWILALAASAACASGPIPPKVSFVHSGLIERFCAGEKPNAAVLAEIEARLPELEAAWAKEGPTLMAETVKLTGKPYTWAEAVATLHGCPDLPSMSFPLLISAVRQTQAWTASPPPAVPPSGKPVPGPRNRDRVEDFTYTVWHETAHRYVDEILKGKGGHTPLLQRYGGESGMILNHLHVLSLDKLLYTRLGRAAEYEARRARMKAMNAAPLMRTFDIIEAEGAEKFVDELR